MWATSDTEVCAGQYDLVRKMTCWEVIQRQAPSTGWVERTSSAFSTASLFATGLSKFTVIGMPMPTVSRAEGVTSLTLIDEDAFIVVNLLVVVVTLPPAFFAVAVTV